MRKLQLIVCLTFAFFVAGIDSIAQENITIFPIFSEMAYFPGGEDSLKNYLKRNVVYPQDAIDNEIKGSINVQFSISKDGFVINEKIKNSLYPSCDSVALDVVKRMPKWVVSKDNHSENDSFTLPIVFRMPFYPEYLNGERIYLRPDTLPQYSEGNTALHYFLKYNVKHPYLSSQLPLQGRVILRVVIDENGNVWNIKEMRSPDENMTKEAIRVVGLMPKWIPAIHDGQRVKAYSIIVIPFKID
ncbi:MAG: TonB family protein [Dysgonomonas sp.]|nr:TonB family protein [Dysgonomonas sp.]